MPIHRFSLAQLQLKMEALSYWHQSAGLLRRTGSWPCGPVPRTSSIEPGPSKIRYAECWRLPDQPGHGREGIADGRKTVALPPARSRKVVRPSHCRQSERELISSSVSSLPNLRDWVDSALISIKTCSDP